MLYRFNSTAGPTVTMTKYGEPYKLQYERTSTQNGVTGNYSWVIQPLSYLSVGDKFQFTMPSPTRFTDKTRCFGTSFWINEELPCTTSNFYQTVTMTIRITGKGRRL